MRPDSLPRSPLTDDEKKQLEENILRDGIQDPLKVWQGTLIDGHNRYEIAQRHGLTFTTVEMQFATRGDAVIWIIKNQFGRRNLSAYDRSILALKLKPVIAAKADERMNPEYGKKTLSKYLVRVPIQTIKLRKNQSPQLLPIMHSGKSRKKIPKSL